MGKIFTLLIGNIDFLLLKIYLYRIPSFLRYHIDCSGQVKLATVLESFQYKPSDSFVVNPPLY